MGKRIVIIGGGPGGYTAAFHAACPGAEVTVIEQESIGGTCLNHGCIPSKVMKTTAQMLVKIRKSSEFGINLHGTASPDMRTLMARKQKVVEDQAHGLIKRFKAQKIRYVQGRAYIGRHGSVLVENADGKTNEVPWDKIILATGSRPLNMKALPFDGEKILSSTDALSLSQIPQSLLIVGGGYIGCEFAFIYSALGSRVTVVEAMERMLPLPSVDEDCSKTLQREMKKHRIDFLVNQTVEKVDETPENLRVTVIGSPSSNHQKTRDHSPRILEVDKVLVCTGRAPNTANLGLENLGVALDDKGWIIADEAMRTNIPDVFAIGDALGPAKIMLAHVAAAEGRTAAENAAGGNDRMDYSVVPGTIFTSPEIANVGLTEIQARERGYEFRADTVLFRTVGKAHIMGEIAGQAKIVSDSRNGKILGIHLMGPHAADLIAEGVLAVRMGHTVRDIAETIHAHPTLAEIMMEASMKALDR